jgi:8-oxo-dGTP diphosphatase
MKVRPSALIIEKNHVLLLRYHYAGHDVLALPGGNQDPGETLAQTLERELREELNIEIEIDGLAFLGEVIQAPPKHDVLHSVFVAQIIGGIPRLNPEHTSALEVVWKPTATLASLNLYPNIGEVILQGKTGYIGAINQVFFE